MTTLKTNKPVNIDKDGFLVNENDWNEDVAQVLASHEGLPTLSTEQLEIIRFMREYYHKFEAFPILNYVCKGIERPRECVNEEFINPEKAWKIAGLPKLDGVHFVSVDGGKSYLMQECC